MTNYQQSADKYREEAIKLLTELLTSAGVDMDAVDNSHTINKFKVELLVNALMTGTLLQGIAIKEKS